MATPSPSFTPRLRMTRHSPTHYDRIQVASTSESGPSRLPDFSQLVNINLDDMASDITEQPTQSRIPTTSTTTRSDNPAAVLRALLSRLPNQSSSPLPQSPQQYLSDRDSECEHKGLADATPASKSQAQESLRDIFSKARRDPDTPRKSSRRRNSIGPSEVGVNTESRNEISAKGKQRSFSDDEFDQNSRTPYPAKPSKRPKTSPQPITKEFLRERFSTSYASADGGEDSSRHVYDPSNESLLRELDSSGAIPPAATSTPQHSLRMSVNSQFHTNLLESDTEMQHAIEGLDSYGDDRSLSPPPTIRRGPKTNTYQLGSSLSGPNQDFDHTPLRTSTRDNNMRQESGLSGISYKVDLGVRNQSCSVTNDPLDPRGHQTVSLSSMDLTSPLSGGAEAFHLKKKSFSMNDSHNNIVETQERERTNSDIVTSSNRSINDYRQQSRRSERQSRSFPHSPSGSSADLLNGPGVEQTQTPDNGLDSPQPLHLLSGSRSYSPTPTNQSNNSCQSPEEPVKLTHSHPSFAHRELSPISEGTSQKIDDMRRDLSQPSRSTTPLPSISKKRPASPSSSTIARKLKASPSLIPNGKRAVSAITTKEPPSKFMSDFTGTQSIHEFLSIPRSEEHPSKSNAQVELSRRNQDDQVSETDELRDTDFSSRDGTPILPASSRNVDVSGSSSLDLSQFPIPPTTSRTTSRDHISFRSMSPGHSTAPLTPPQRPTSRNQRHAFRTPSPPQALPDLPTPSSSEESQDTPSANSSRAVTNTHQEPTSLQTPRPPGGWTSTPKLRHNPLNDSELSDDGRYSDDYALQYPKTPSNLNSRHIGSILDTIGKTPRPPGGWLATPGPVSAATSNKETSQQNVGLPTPMTSLSKGTGVDPKTPGVPGGWLTTPVARKSILKVRFDPHDQPAQLPGNATHGSMAEVYDDNSTVNSPTREKSVPLPPSPRSPRKGKTTIRVVDAFGRQQTQAEAEAENDKAKRSMLRVVDALGREVQQSDPSTVEGISLAQGLKASSRGELLAHIRQSLDNLATEFDHETMDDNLAASQVRIEELNTVSQKARLARKQIQTQSPLRSLADLNPKPQAGFLRNRRRFWLTLLLIQLILLMFMFRISSHWEKQRYLTSFYDPFNPELYLYESNFDYSSHVIGDVFSRASWFSYARRRFSFETGIWHDWLRLSRDIRSYILDILTPEPLPRNGSAWLPT